MINVKINGKIETIKFCIKFVLIKLEDDSKKTIKRKANKYTLNLLILYKWSLLDFNIIKSDIDIKKVIYNGFTNLE